MQKLKISLEGNLSANVLYLPALRDSDQVLFLLSEIWGINQHILEIAEQYVNLGFHVLIPNVFFRQKETVCLDYDEQDTQTAYHLYQQLDLVQAATDLDQIMDQSLKMIGKTQIHILGFCMGGTLCYLLKNAQIKTRIAYYGSKIGQYLEQIQSIQQPTIIHLALNDHLIGLEEIDHLKKAVQSSKNIQIFCYDKVGHGFNCPYRVNYNKAASELAYQTNLLFLNNFLGER